MYFIFILLHIKMEIPWTASESDAKLGYVGRKDEKTCKAKLEDEKSGAYLIRLSSRCVGIYLMLKVYKHVFNIPIDVKKSGRLEIMTVTEYQTASTKNKYTNFTMLLQNFPCQEIYEKYSMIDPSVYRVSSWAAKHLKKRVRHSDVVEYE
jgi:hypothetical protein